MSSTTPPSPSPSPSPSHHHHHHLQQQQQQQQQQRQCSNCKCTQTPLWRRSPLGPKTLCNACGVRMKKGRLIFVPATNLFITVESPAALAKRLKKEQQQQQLENRHNLPPAQPVSAPNSVAVQGVSRGGVKKSSSASTWRKKGFKGGAGLYYLLAAIEFVETS